MKKTIIVAFLALCLGISLATATESRADLITATLTADNHYGLYVGNAAGTALTLIGRNEYGDGGNPGDYNWSLPETFQFSAYKGQSVYVVAWTDDNSPRSWIGQFASSNGTTLLSNLSQWQYTVGSGGNPGRDGELPALSIIKNDIANAAWQTPRASGNNDGSEVWGVIPGISGSAKFVWSDNLYDDSTTDDNYVIFKADAPATSPVPLPPSPPFSSSPRVSWGSSV